MESQLNQRPNPLTRQEAFDQVWQWFVVEEHGWSRENTIGCCSYRTPDGDRCAIGVLLTDSMINEIEDRDLSCDPVTWIMAIQPIAERLINLDADFLHVLQSCHDNGDTLDHGRFTADITRNLIALARCYQLRIPDDAKGLDCN